MRNKQPAGPTETAVPKASRKRAGRRFFIVPRAKWESMIASAEPPVSALAINTGGATEASREHRKHAGLQAGTIETVLIEVLGTLRSEAKSVVTVTEVRS